MTNEWKWRQRLEAEIEKSGRSMRAISESAGFSHSYLHGMLREGKDPTISKLIAICDVLNVSVIYILHGLEVSPEDEDLLSRVNSDPETLRAIRAVLQLTKAKESP